MTRLSGRVYFWVQEAWANFPIPKNQPTQEKRFQPKWPTVTQKFAHCQMRRERKNLPEDPTVEAGVIDSTGQIRKPRWYRYEVKQLLGRGKLMPETTFKRRLMLLEEEAPEFNKTPYHRQFSSFQVWCLVTQETWLKEANYCIDSVRKRFANEGLPTHEYDEYWRPND